MFAFVHVCVCVCVCVSTTVLGYWFLKERRRYCMCVLIHIRCSCFKITLSLQITVITEDYSLPGFDTSFFGEWFSALQGTYVFLSQVDRKWLLELPSTQFNMFQQHSFMGSSKIVRTKESYLQKMSSIILCNIDILYLWVMTWLFN